MKQGKCKEIFIRDFPKHFHTKIFSQRMSKNFSTMQFSFTYMFTYSFPTYMLPGFGVLSVWTFVKTWRIHRNGSRVSSEIVSQVFSGVEFLLACLKNTFWIFPTFLGLSNIFLYFLLLGNPPIQNYPLWWSSTPQPICGSPTNKSTSTHQPPQPHHPFPFFRRDCEWKKKTSPLAALKFCLPMAMAHRLPDSTTSWASLPLKQLF